MRGRRVIAVEAVFHQELPVRTNTVFLGAADDFHARFGLVHHDVDVSLGIGEIIGQRNCIAIQIQEIEAAIILQPRDGGQVRAFVLAEIVRVIAVGDAGCKRSRVAERPAMIKTLKAQRIAAPFAHDRCAPMRTDVEEGMNVPGPVAIEHDIAPGHAAGEEIIRIRDFRFMADINPAAVEDRTALQFEHVFVDEGPPRHLETMIVAILANPRRARVRSRRLVSHSGLPGLPAACASARKNSHETKTDATMV